MKTIKRIEIKTTRIGVSENGEVYNQSINSPEGIVQAARHLTKGYEQEYFLVFILDAKNKVIGYVEAARGGIDSCVVDPRVVFRAAIHLGATSIIASHNHPAGNPNPSEQDDRMTVRLARAASLLGITFLDHIIVADEGVYSYAEMAPDCLIGSFTVN